jgi:hypothetical protein
MTKAGSVHSTPQTTAFKIVAGNDFVAQPPAASAPEEPLPEQRKREARGPCKELRPIEY